MAAIVEWAMMQPLTSFGTDQRSGTVMKWIVRLSLLAFTLACLATAGQPAAAQDLKNPKVEIAYVPPKTAKYEPE